MKLLNEIQQKLKAPKNQRNSFGNYNYRSCEDILEAVKPLLGDGAIILFDEIVNVGQFNYVKATAQLSDGSGTHTATGWAREAVTKKGMVDAQITGSASSYARKYALNGLFCIDDSKDADTNAYSKPPKQEKPKPTPLPKMNEHEVSAMTSVFLIAIANKPADQEEKAFKAEAANKLYKLMGHWPTTQQEQEEAIAILDKEYKK